MSSSECPTCEDAQSNSETTSEHIYLFVAERGTETLHFLVEASNQGDAEEKLARQFEEFGDADCLGTPKGVMDLHSPEVVML